MVNDTSNMIDLEKELLWLEAKYSDIVEGISEEINGYQPSMEDEDIENSNVSIEDIERFIDDSYLNMLEKKNIEKDFEICILKEELSHAYEVQDQMLIDSHGLPLQFVEDDKVEEEDINKYKDCHVRLCYELYLDAYQRDVTKQRKDKNFGRLRLNLKGLKIMNLKPLLVSTKYLFKKKSSKTKKSRNPINQNSSNELMLTYQQIQC